MPEKAPKSLPQTSNSSDEVTKTTKIPSANPKKDLENPAL